MHRLALAACSVEEDVVYVCKTWESETTCASLIDRDENDEIAMRDSEAADGC